MPTVQVLRCACATAIPVPVRFVGRRIKCRRCGAVSRVLGGPLSPVLGRGAPRPWERDELASAPERDRVR